MPIRSVASIIVSFSVWTVGGVGRDAPFRPNKAVLKTEEVKNADFTRGPSPRCCCGCDFLSRINEAWIENKLAVFTFAIHENGNGNSR